MDKSVTGDFYGYFHSFRSLQSRFVINSKEAYNGVTYFIFQWKGRIHRKEAYRNDFVFTDVQMFELVFRKCEIRNCLVCIIHARFQPSIFNRLNAIRNDIKAKFMPFEFIEIRSMLSNRLTRENKEDLPNKHMETGEEEFQSFFMHFFIIFKNIVSLPDLPNSNVVCVANTKWAEKKRIILSLTNRISPQLIFITSNKSNGKRTSFKQKKATVDVNVESEYVIMTQVFAHGKLFTFITPY